MRTQKGLALDDIVAIASEDYHYLTLSVSIPGYEEHTLTKEYSGKEEYIRNIDADIREFQKSLARTVFTVEESDVEEPTVVNDSWGAIWKDAKTELKSKIFARN